jgi:hypothetical protein
MKHENRLKSIEQENAPGTQELRQKSGHEFATTEEMLRHDALHTPVPPSIAYRLQQSIGDCMPSAKSWWRKLFSK